MFLHFLLYALLLCWCVKNYQLLGLTQNCEHVRSYHLWHHDQRYDTCLVMIWIIWCVSLVLVVYLCIWSIFDLDKFCSSAWWMCSVFLLKCHFCFRVHSQIMYRPLKELTGIPGANELLICLTGYQGADREDIMVLCILLLDFFIL